MKNLRTLKESLKNLFRGNAKVDRKGINGKQAIALTLASIGVVGMLTGCSTKTNDANVETPDTTISSETLDEQLAATEDRVQAILSENICTQKNCYLYL